MPIVSGLIRRTHRFTEPLLHQLLYAGSDMGSLPRGPARHVEDLESCCVLVVGAHPDDEAIGAGALLSRVRDAGVITITDGAPSSQAAARALGYATPRDLAGARLAEQRAALDLLGRDLALTVNFGVRDQKAAYHVVRIVRRLVKIFAQGRFDVVVTHPYEGGHPDHDATALAVQVACALLRRAGATAPRVVEMASYHSQDGRIVYGEFLPHAYAGPMASFPLDDEGRQLKQKMYACHASQQRVLARFPFEAEKFREAPPYDFLRPPHVGPLTYDGYGWGIDGESWRRAAARALHHMGLLRRTRARPAQLAAAPDAGVRSPEAPAARGEATSTMKSNF